MRCGHLNGTLSEVALHTHGIIVRGGEPIYGLDGDPTITHYEFVCNDCGKHWRWPPGRHPRWIEALLVRYDKDLLASWLNR